MIEVLGVFVTPLQIIYSIGMLVVAIGMVWTRESIRHALDGDSYAIGFTFLAATVLWPLFFAILIYILWRGPRWEGIKEDDPDPED